MTLTDTKSTLRMMQVESIPVFNSLCQNCQEFLEQFHPGPRFSETESKRNSPVADVLAAAKEGCGICHRAISFVRTVAPDRFESAEARESKVEFEFRSPPIFEADGAEFRDANVTVAISSANFSLRFRLQRLAEAAPTPQLSVDDQNTGSPESFARAAGWLSDCISNHDDCNRQNMPENWLPTRLLDVGSGPDFDQAIKLREAVQAVRTLGTRYLWIDSLCIMQDGEDDWNRESLLMAYVYGGCVLNMAAMVSENCGGGLFRPRRWQDAGPTVVSLSDKAGSAHLYLLLQESFWRIELEETILNSRAWVMQERILSPRTLSFANTPSLLGMQM